MFLSLSISFSQVVNCAVRIRWACLSCQYIDVHLFKYNTITVGIRRIGTRFRICIVQKFWAFHLKAQKYKQTHTHTHTSCHTERKQITHTHTFALHGISEIYVHSQATFNQISSVRACVCVSCFQIYDIRFAPYRISFVFAIVITIINAIILLLVFSLMTDVCACISLPHTQYAYVCA